MANKQTLNDLETGLIHIWHIDLDGTTDMLYQLLSAEELEKAKAKLQKRDRDRYIRARGSMRYILGNYVGIPGNELMFTLGEKGKPAVNQHKSVIEFNLTHCEGVALLAVTKSTPVGIDLEYIRSKPSLLKIAQRTFTDEVYSELKQLQSGQLDAAFYRHWTEFEARTKCVGDGIFSTGDEDNGITSEHFYPQEGWIACVAVRGVDVSSMRLTHLVFRN